MHNNRKMCDSTMISAKICMNLSYPQIEGARKKMIQRDDLDFFPKASHPGEYFITIFYHHYSRRR